MLLGLFSRNILKQKIQLGVNMQITDLANNKIMVKNCLGCEVINGDIEVFGGILYNGQYFTVTQDIELPINGFLIITSKRHIEKFVDLYLEEQQELTNIIYTTLKILESNNIAEEYNVVLEEKSGYHFHVWLMPRHQWMIQKFGKVLKNIKAIQEYAIENMKTKENLEKIKSTCLLVKEGLNNYEQNTKK